MVSNSAVAGGIDRPTGEMRSGEEGAMFGGDPRCLRHLVSNVHSVTDEKPWRGTATRAFEAFDRVESIAAAALSPSLMAPVRRDVARLLRNNSDLRRTPEPDLGSLDERVPACERFAEQFVVDVAGITDDDRSALVAAMGSESFMVSLS